MAIKLNSALLIVASLLLTSCTSKAANIERKFYNPWEKDIGYVQVIKVDNFIYISGITSEADTLEKQLDDIYGIAQKILSDYGTNTSAIIKEVIYTKDIESLKSAIEHRKQFFQYENYPTATWVQVDRLYMENHQLEIELVALAPN